MLTFPNMNLVARRKGWHTGVLLQPCLAKCTSPSLCCCEPREYNDPCSTQVPFSSRHKPTISLMCLLTHWTSGAVVSACGLILGLLWAFFPFRLHICYRITHLWAQLWMSPTPKKGLKHFQWASYFLVFCGIQHFLQPFWLNGIRLISDFHYPTSVNYENKNQHLPSHANCWKFNPLH